MPEPKITDGGGAEGEESVSSVIPEASYGPQFGPNPSPKTFLAILGKVRFLWSWTLSMGPGHLNEEFIHGYFYGLMDPLEVWPKGLNLVLGGSSNPHRPQKLGQIKDQRIPKRAKTAPHHQFINNSHGIGQDPKHSRESKMAKNHNSGQFQGQWGQAPSLDNAKVQ
ncbi:hypothetical protein O181_023484 [Austropuccinia psidii MF-1]|uniref:Uncharacterized protein n=1 Tax=Austropuccinia psidii MF-1 TaxID=1389203 RepID=A0A9Q3CGS8_9BASI|nr:hypothetical protein [Austropuccinia psidii MF-1]